jgi:hypothetical protein
LPYPFALAFFAYALILFIEKIAFNSHALIEHDHEDEDEYHAREGGARKSDDVGDGEDGGHGHSHGEVGGHGHSHGGDEGHGHSHGVVEGNGHSHSRKEVHGHSNGNHALDSDLKHPLLPIRTGP